MRVGSIVGAWGVCLAAACSNSTAPFVGSTSSGTSGSSTSAGTTASSGSTTSVGTSSGSSSSGGGGSTGINSSAGGGSTAAGSTGGGSSNSSGSSGGGTSGGAIGSCVDTLGETEFGLGYCPSSPCQCPLQCVPEPRLGTGFVTCEFPCQTTADCQNAGELCRNGFCTIDECGQEDGGNGVIWGACDSLDAGDGTCALPAGGEASLVQPLFDFTPALFLCQQNGTSTDVCDTLATRADDSLRCAAGLVCNSNIAGLDGGSSGMCVHGCDPSAPACPTGQLCSGATPRQGYCYPSGNGGCAVGLPDDRYQQCENSGLCSCPSTCVVDPDVDAGTFCEPACATSADCQNIGTICVGGSCVVNFCAENPSGPVAGAYGQPCTSISGADGTCTPYSDFVTGKELGVCIRAGTATTSCSYVFDFGSVLPAGRILSTGELCPAGQICTVFGDAGASCASLCNPLDNPDAGGCPTNTVCLQQDLFTPDLAFCGACLPSGGFCFRDGDCCGGSCGSDAGPFVCP